MKKLLPFLILILSTFSITAQDLLFSDLGSEPAYCRLYDYQNGNGVVHAEATGGTPDYEYSMEELSTGITVPYATWGGRNPGYYKITVTDALGVTIEETIYLDSLNPIANFNVVSDDLDEDYIGTGPAFVQFENTSENFANPNNPLADTTFFWNLNEPTEDWELSHDYFEISEYTYDYAGEYSVLLVATNKNGCTDTTSKVITLTGPFASISNHNEQNINLISQIDQRQIVVVNSSFQEPILLKIYALSGALIIEQTIVDAYTPIHFNFNSGIYIYEFVDPKTGELNAGKFNY